MFSCLLSFWLPEFRGLFTSYLVAATWFSDSYEGSREFSSRVWKFLEPIACRYFVIMPPEFEVKKKVKSMQLVDERLIFLQISRIHTKHQVGLILSTWLAIFPLFLRLVHSYEGSLFSFSFFV